MNTAKLNGRLSEEGEIPPSESTQPPVEHAANEFLSSKSYDGESPTRHTTRFAAQPTRAPSPASLSRIVTSPAPTATDFHAAKILAPAAVFIPPLLPPNPAKPQLPAPVSSSESELAATKPSTPQLIEYIPKEARMQSEKEELHSHVSRSAWQRLHRSPHANVISYKGVYKDDPHQASVIINGLAIQTLRRGVEHAPSHAKGAGSSWQPIALTAAKFGQGTSKKQGKRYK
jgi:hypothetical protein